MLSTKAKLSGGMHTINHVLHLLNKYEKLRKKNRDNWFMVHFSNKSLEGKVTRTWGVLYDEKTTRLAGIEIR